MHSILIISKNTKESLDYARNLCLIQTISDADVSVFDNTINIINDDKKTKNSIGVEDIKKLKKKLYLKPIYGTQKAVIICNSHLLTVEAQNAMLKILEEPPGNTLIILTSNTKEAFISTIISRCSLIELENKESLSQTEIDKLTNQIVNLRTMTIFERLAFAELMAKNKEEVTVWIENMILILRNIIITSILEKSDENIKIYKLFIKEFQKTYQEVKATNINVRMSLENLFLAIS